jgi:2-hydroxy-6-oxonona-2,4-dienedioate hydrolase
VTPERRGRRGEGAASVEEALDRSDSAAKPDEALDRSGSVGKPDGPDVVDGVAIPPAALAEAAAAWSRTQRVDVGHWRVRYREAGAGPPLVLVHGLGCSADYWWRNGAPIAAAGFRVLAPDLPGFGRTEGPRSGLTIDQQARALERFAAALEVGPAAYLGHSLSCQTAIELAARRPELVSALVLAAPTGDRRKKRRLREAVGFFRDVVREPPDLVPVIADAYLRAGFIRWLGTWLAGKGHDTFAAAARVRCPALVLVGTDDPVVSEHFARAMAGALPGAACRTVENAAHALIFDEFQAFNREVVRFLREAVPGSSPSG